MNYDDFTINKNYIFAYIVYNKNCVKIINNT